MTEMWWKYDVDTAIFQGSFTRMIYVSTRPDSIEINCLTVISNPVALVLLKSPKFDGEG